jgi:hypothetical protein
MVFANETPKLTGLLEDSSKNGFTVFEIGKF